MSGRFDFDRLSRWKALEHSRWQAWPCLLKRECVAACKVSIEVAATKFQGNACATQHACQLIERISLQTRDCVVPNGCF